MKFTNEQLAKAKDAKRAEELLALAKETGVELTEEEAAKYFAELHKEGNLADDELDNVVGGCDDDEPPKPLFTLYQHVWAGSPLNSAEIVGISDYDANKGYLYDVYLIRFDKYCTYSENELHAV